MNRLKRFYLRFKNQYKTHGDYLSLWKVIYIAWRQSEPFKENKKLNIKRETIKFIEENQKIFDELAKK